jgi:hypothetical protein
MKNEIRETVHEHGEFVLDARVSEDADLHELGMEGHRSSMPTFADESGRHGSLQDAWCCLRAMAEPRA